MSDFGEYDGNTEHDMWVDYTYHENTGELTDWYGDDDDDPLPPYGVDFGYQMSESPMEKAQLPIVRDIDFSNLIAHRQGDDSDEPISILLAKRRERELTGWTLGSCLFAIIVALVIFLTIYD